MVLAVHRPFYISILIYIYIVSENKIWTENHKCDLDEIKSVTRVGVACAQPELLPMFSLWTIFAAENDRRHFRLSNYEIIPGSMPPHLQSLAPPPCRGP